MLFNSVLLKWGGGLDVLHLDGPAGSTAYLIVFNETLLHISDQKGYMALHFVPN